MKYTSSAVLFRSIRSALLLALTFAAMPESARAQDRRSFPYRGVTHIHRMQPGLDAHVLLVDLTSSEIDVVATRPRERSATVSMFAREYGAQIAINANFYAGSVCGLAVGEGREWSDAYTDRCTASIGFGRTPLGLRASVFDSSGWTRHNPLPWATQIVSGMPMLLWHGAVVFEPQEPTGMYRTHPRTALGMAADRHTLVVAVIDGRRTGLPGVTSLEMIPLLEEFGARDALNLDGGGSSELYIEAEGGVVNRPSDRRERTVMNHLGFRITSVP